MRLVMIGLFLAASLGWSARGAEPSTETPASSRLSVSSGGEFDWYLGDPPEALRYKGKLYEGRILANVFERSRLVASIEGQCEVNGKMDLEVSFEGLGKARLKFDPGADPTGASEIAASQCQVLQELGWVKQTKNVIPNAFPSRLPPASDTAQHASVGAVLASLDFAGDAPSVLKQCGVKGAQ